MEEDNENSMTQKLEVVTKNMENTENPVVARKPEAVIPKVEGNEPPLVRKAEAVTPKVEKTEASSQEPRPEAKPQTVTPKAGDSNNAVERKPEAVIVKAEDTKTPPARKPEEITPQPAGNETPVARKPEAVPPKAEVPNNVVARRPEAVMPKAEAGNLVVRKPEAVPPKAEAPNNVVARKPEAVMPKVDAGNLVVRKPEAVVPKGESIGYPTARNPEVTNNSQARWPEPPTARLAPVDYPQTRRPESPMPRPAPVDYSQSRQPEPPMPRPAPVDYSQPRRPEASLPRVERDLVIPETPVPPSPGRPVRVRYKRVPPAYTRFIPQYDAAKVHLIEEQCRSFCISLFFREHDSIHSLGITSSIPGEGKSFIATMMAHVLSSDSPRPILLVECDWENAHNDDYFGIPPVPGLAEWLRGECAETDIRYQVSDNLTVIRAGDGQQDAVRLIQNILKHGLQNTLAHNDENLLVDLPPVITSSYSIFAANMVEALALVVRAGVTPDYLVADACSYLGNLPMQGIILNQVDYHPRPYSPARKTV